MLSAFHERKSDSQRFPARSITSSDAVRILMDVLMHISVCSYVEIRRRICKDAHREDRDHSVSRMYGFDAAYVRSVGKCVLVLGVLAHTPGRRAVHPSCLNASYMRLRVSGIAFSSSSSSRSNPPIFAAFSATNIRSLRAAICIFSGSPAACDNS